MKNKIYTVFVLIMLTIVSSCKKDTLTDQRNDNQGVSFTLNAGTALNQQIVSAQPLIMPM